MRVRLDDPAPGRVTLIGPATFVGTVEEWSCEVRVGHRSERAAQDERTAEAAQEDVDHVSYDEALGATLIERGIRRRSCSSGSRSRRARRQGRAGARRAGAAGRHRGPTSWRASNSGVGVPTPTFVGQGKAENCATCAWPWTPTRWSQRPHAGAAVQASRSCSVAAIERTAVILDIFAQTPTLEGRAQVELALLQYRLPGCAAARIGCHSRAVGSAPARAPVRRSWRRSSPPHASDRFLDDLADLQRNRQLNVRSRSGVAWAT